MMKWKPLFLVVEVSARLPTKCSELCLAWTNLRKSWLVSAGPWLPWLPWSQMPYTSGATWRKVKMGVIRQVYAETKTGL